MTTTKELLFAIKKLVGFIERRDLTEADLSVLEEALTNLLNKVKVAKERNRP